MTAEAPSSFNQHIFFDASSVFYGTDDGHQDGSFAEFRLFESFCQDASPARRENIHFVSAIGGLYGLNLLPLFRPKQITFFDINPHAVDYFNVIRKVFACSSSKRDFLDRLSNQDFEVVSPAEELIRENLALKQQGRLPRSRGSSKRSFEASWRYALDRFDLTKELLTTVPLEIRTEGIESDSFGDFIRDGRNLWVFCSNIVEFTFSGLQFNHPDNAVMVSLVYPGQVELLDLSPFGDRPVDVQFEIPLKASVVGESLIPEDTPTTAVADDKIDQLATFCRDRLELSPDGRILDIGCNWGRLAIALDSYLDSGGEYEGFDPQREHVLWAKQELMPVYKNCTFHIANIRNRIYNPDGSLDPVSFRFPYDDARFDVVVAHSLFTYMLPVEFEHYMAEVVRVLKPGGRFFGTFFLLDAESRPAAALRSEPHCFRYFDEQITTTGPNRGGLAAYEEEYVRNVITSSGIDLSETIPGTWRGRSDGFLEDAVFGSKS